MNPHPLHVGPLLRVAARVRSPLIVMAVLLLTGCGSLQSLPWLGGARPAGNTPTVAAPAASAPAMAGPTNPPAAMLPPAPPGAPLRTTPPLPPDAVPRVERISTMLPNLPYHVRGQDYEPNNSDVPLRESGIASWYGEPFHGRRTSTGEVYDMDKMTAAHKTMALPSYAVVRNRRNGKQVVVRVNDRGPFKDGRVIDLSRAAARRLGFSGLADVEVKRLTHAEIRSGAWKQPRQTLASSSP